MPSFVQRAAAAARWSRGLSLAGAAMLAVAMLVPAAHADDASDWNAVIAAAKKEGELTLYYGSSLPSPKQVVKMFQDKYGITVNTIEARPAEIRARVRTEQANGRFLGDIRIAGITSSAPEEKEGAYQAHQYLPNAAKLRPGFEDTGKLIPFMSNRFGILINTRLVPPDQEPKSWADLLDPKWKGKILSIDPRVAGNAQGLYSVFYDHWGRGFLEKLAAQHPVFTREPPVANRRIAQGEQRNAIPCKIYRATFWRSFNARWMSRCASFLAADSRLS